MKQGERKDLIVKFIEECRYSPTVREIGAAVGLSSPSTVHRHLDDLVREGRVKRAGTRVYA